MDYADDIPVSASPLFDYSKFLLDEFLTDCEIHIHQSPNDPNYKNIKGHILILANCSAFFYNAYTSGMKEAETRVCDIWSNPLDLVPKVINFMYNGAIELNNEELVPLLHVAHDLGISILETTILKKLEDQKTPDLLMSCIDQCYDCAFSEQLTVMIPFIVKHYNDIPMNVMTDKLDVETFVKVMLIARKKYNFSTEKVINDLTAFIGPTYEISNSEKRICVDVFDQHEPKLKALLTKSNPRWLPNGYLKLLH